MNYYVVHNNCIIYGSSYFIDSWLYVRLYCDEAIVVGNDGEWKVKGIKDENQTTVD